LDNWYWAAACSWALAGNSDSSFHLLNKIATSDKVTKGKAGDIRDDNDLASLHSDKRWLSFVDKLIKKAKENSYVQEEIIYKRKDGMACTMIWIKPKVKTNNRAIIYVMSGAWISNYNGTEVSTDAAEQFLARGYSVFAVFHGSQPRYTLPEIVSDIKRAVRYIRYNANKFAIDPDHIGITGTSAGGHLSLVVATADDNIYPNASDPVNRVSSKVQAVAVLFPPTDLLNWDGPGSNLVNATDRLKAAGVWEAFDFKKLNERYRYYEEVTDTSARNKIGWEISPINFVSPDDPPVFIIHGDADPTVPLQQSQSIIEKFNKAGVPNRFIIKKGGKHNPDDMKPEWLEFVDWFDKYLK
jgi:acetyl esterase/lipase